jgi:hypothetical protein
VTRDSRMPFARSSMLGELGPTIPGTAST